MTEWTPPPIPDKWIVQEVPGWRIEDGTCVTVILYDNPSIILNDDDDTFPCNASIMVVI